MSRLPLLMAVCVFALLGGCDALKPATAPRPHFYALDAAPAKKPSPLPAPSLNAPTLVVSSPRAAAGFDSARMVYLRQPYALEHFAHNEWVDTPARMLAPLIVAAVERSGAFRAVVQTPSPASGDLRLDTEVVRLQHEFMEQPSRVRFTLRAYLVDIASRRVLATREFNALASATSEDPYGGVRAANEAVGASLAELAAFCAEAARKFQPRGAPGDAGR